MRHLPDLFANNRAWAKSRAEADPDYFRELAREQNPGYLWIGCADSRVPANEIVGLQPGELFVHRNVANMVVHTDLNCLSVLEFAVQFLHVPHIIVCGHYGCGGVAAAWRRNPVGLVDNWLRHVEDVASHYQDELSSLGDEDRIIDRLCELNALEQALNVCRTSVVQDAWRRGQRLTVHGWIYSLEDGLLQDLGFSVTGPEGMDAAFRAAITPP
jgi:carbonic anhydrase